MSVRRFGRKCVQYLIPILFYAAFVGLYLYSFREIWVHKQFFVDFTVRDAGIFDHNVLYRPVLAIGGMVLLGFLLFVWRRWSRKLMCFIHVLLGMSALAYCGTIWADVEQGFNLFSAESWFKSGAELGMGFFLFFASVVCLIFAGLSMLTICLQSERCTV